MFVLFLLFGPALAISPFILRDGCPDINPAYDGSAPDRHVCEWSLEMCTSCDSYCTPGPTFPTQEPSCSIRSVDCDKTSKPTYTSSSTPTGKPVLQPTSFPTYITTKINKDTPRPSDAPSANPSDEPSTIPTSQPITGSPTSLPSNNPTRGPSRNPSKSPSKNPSDAPSQTPSDTPSEYPTWIATGKDRCPQSVFIEY